MVLCPYWANTRRWFSTGFTPSSQRNRYATLFFDGAILQRRVHVFALVAATRLKAERCTAHGWNLQQALSILRSATGPLSPGYRVILKLPLLFDSPSYICDIIWICIPTRLEMLSFSVPMYQAISVNFGNARQVAATSANNANCNFMYIGPCIIVIVEE